MDASRKDYKDTMEKVIIVVGMLVSGSINTLTKKIQNDSKAKGASGYDSHDFNHPWLIMF